jgi:folate-dependent phosphoribosylglycinamide formyltransferase PurN
MRLAVFTVDCFVATPAVVRFIGRNHHDIALVVRSSPGRHRARRPLRKLYRTWRWSGGGLIAFLLADFVLFALLSLVIDGLAILFPKRLRAVSLSQACRRHAIPLISACDINHDSVIAALRASHAELAITYFFDQVLRGRLIAALPMKPINVHPGLLPAFRGIFPVFHQLADEPPRLGLTIHAIEDETLDTGPILARAEAEPPRCRSLLTAYKGLMDNSVELLELVLQDMASGNRAPQPQGPGRYYALPPRSSMKRLKRRGYRPYCLREMVDALWRLARIRRQSRRIPASRLASSSGR